MHKYSGYMKDEVNPSFDELRRWAYADEYEPTQDFDLIVGSDPRKMPIILELASDPDCPSGKFFLACLYIVTSRAVAGKFEEYPRNVLEEMIGRAEKSALKRLNRWAHRSREHIAGRMEYNYEMWTDHGFAINDPWD